MQMAQQHGREWRNILENKVRQSKIFKLYCVSCICLNWQAFVKLIRPKRSLLLMKDNE